jgi:hypothetical protein
MRATALVIAMALSTAGVLAQVWNDQGAYGRVIRIDRSGFKPNAGRITFSELPLGSKNPVYVPSAYGGDASGVTVRFGGFFMGQRRGKRSECQGGGAITGCVMGQPSSPLTLDPHSPATQIAADTATADSPVLSGSPKFNGPVSMQFEPNIAGVGLLGGFFNAVKGTSILAFDRQGRQIGGVVNLATGMEYMALVTEDGSEAIAGLQFSLVGPEPFGFAIDNLSFARRSELQTSARPAGVGERSLGDIFKEKPGATPKSPVPSPPAAAAPTGSLKDLFR